MIDTELALRENVAWVDKHNLIHTVFHGDQTPEKLRHTFDEINDLCDTMAAEGYPLLLLWDIRDVQSIPTESRLLSLSARTHLPFWRLAIVASDEADNVAASVSLHLTAMSARKQEISYFASLFDATKWLSRIAEEYTQAKADWPILPS